MNKNGRIPLYVYCSSCSQEEELGADPGRPQARRPREQGLQGLGVQGVHEVPRVQVCVLHTLSFTLRGHLLTPLGRADDKDNTLGVGSSPEEQAILDQWLFFQVCPFSLCSSQ